MSLSTILKLLILVFVFQLTGCSSLRTMEDSDGYKFKGIAYTGVRINGAYWSCAFEKADAENASIPSRVFGTLFFSLYQIPDLVLSFVLDTLRLPHDIYTNVKNDGENFPVIECDQMAPYFG